MYIFSAGTFNSELWVINLLVLIHSGNVKRSGFQSKAIPKVSVSFYYIIMLTCCVETTNKNRRTSEQRKK